MSLVIDKIGLKYVRMNVALVKKDLTLLLVILCA